MSIEAEQGNDDYSRTKVPEEKTVHGLRIAGIIVGIGITLPVLFLGAEVTQSVGMSTAIWIFVGVCLVLSVLCGITAVIGNRTRLSTYMLLHFPFGKMGAKLINVIVGVTLLGWYAVTIEIFGTSLNDAFTQLLGWNFPAWISILIGSALMTLTALYGIKAMEKLSNISVPLLLIFMVFVLFTSLGGSEWDVIIAFEGSGGIGIREAISAVVGMAILTPVLMPDYSRFARTDKDSLLAVLGLAIGFPIVLLAGGIPSLTTGEIDIMKIMIGLSLTLPALLILIFSTWTTNSANLYSTVLTFSTIFTKQGNWRIGLVASAIGTILAIAGVTGYFIDFLNISSIFIPPVSAIFIADFFFVKKQNYDLKDFDSLPNFDLAAGISWIVACIVAYLGAYDYMTLTTISFFDSFLVAFILYLILKKIIK
ncbi:cytosine permease [Zobellia barbeyronii]|uniref:Cytosine permease n=1 Tax=Zobellia barbeyronii TaxID=2748009 RepID=A0ABS5W9T3_9FLAO|nr:cytosine permease [Zobellia barbeyronii]MBT2160173.1 cytosine permease [Zobellia barbeyronii]